MYLRLDEVQELHLGITNRCNAACPMCDRNQFGGAPRAGLTLGEWTLADAEIAFDPRLTSLRNVLFCGTHGDPAVATQTLAIVELLKRRFPVTVEFYSNAGVRHREWWAELGRILSGRGPQDHHYRQTDLGVFSIDGLADTNHLYRRHTQFERVIENAEAFIQAGGLARWDFIVFKHNEHQVEEAQALAKSLGFKQFRLRKTARFNFSPVGPERWPVVDHHGRLEYYLEPTERKDLRNGEIDKFEAIRNTEGVLNYLNRVKIDCLYKNRFKRYFIDHTLRVFPCSYLGDDFTVGQPNTLFTDPAQPERALKSKKDTYDKVGARYGTDFSALRELGWDGVLAHPWFQRVLEDTWSQGLDEGRLKRCARNCGTEYRPILSQSHDTRLDHDVR